MRCPNNSNSTQSGLSECPCDEGYYRTPQEVDLPCNSEYNFSIIECLPYTLKHDQIYMHACMQCVHLDFIPMQLMEIV